MARKRSVADHQRRDLDGLQLAGSVRRDARLPAVSAQTGAPGDLGVGRVPPEWPADSNQRRGGLTAEHQCRGRLAGISRAFVANPQRLGVTWASGRRRRLC